VAPVLAALSRSTRSVTSRATATDPCATPPPDRFGGGEAEHRGRGGVRSPDDAASVGEDDGFCELLEDGLVQ